MGEKRQRTRISSKISRLPEDVRDQVDIALNDSSVSIESISQWLKENGHDISASAVGRYSMHRTAAAQRVADMLCKTKAIAQMVAQNPEVDYTKASRIIAMDGLLQKVSTADEEYLEMPLEKAVKLIASLSRTEVYEQKSKQSIKSKMELAFDGMEAELDQTMKSQPELYKEFQAVMRKARQQLFDNI